MSFSTTISERIESLEKDNIRLKEKIQDNKEDLQRLKDLQRNIDWKQLKPLTKLIHCDEDEPFSFVSEDPTDYFKVIVITNDIHRFASLYKDDLDLFKE